MENSSPFENVGNWRSGQQPQENGGPTIQPVFPIFCCGNVQRVQNSLPVGRANRARVAFLQDHISHPTIATYDRPPNVIYPAGYFSVPSESFPEPSPPSTAQTEPAASTSTHDLAQQSQQYQAMGMWEDGLMRPNQTPVSSASPLPPAYLIYTIPPTMPIPLPRFRIPSIEPNVNFRLERCRRSPTRPWQSPVMETVWEFWPVQLQIPPYAQVYPNDLLQYRMMVEQGVQIINGERWGFYMDNHILEGAWYKRGCYNLFSCRRCNKVWRVSIFVRRGF